MDTMEENNSYVVFKEIFMGKLGYVGWGEALLCPSPALSTA
jgi:hypothetical protein